MNNPHPPTIELQHQDWAERIPNPEHVAWQQGYEARNVARAKGDNPIVRRA